MSWTTCCSMGKRLTPAFRHRKQPPRGDREGASWRAGGGQRYEFSVRGGDLWHTAFLRGGQPCAGNSEFTARRGNGRRGDTAFAVGEREGEKAPVGEGRVTAVSHRDNGNPLPDGACGSGCSACNGREWHASWRCRRARRQIGRATETAQEDDLIPDIRKNRPVPADILITAECR